MGSRRNSLGLALLANAIPAIGHVIPTPPPAPNATSTACTTVLTSTLSGFRGDWQPEIAHTVYPSTVTESHRVPCGDCVLSISYVLARPWGGLGPEERVTGTVTATAPFTTTTTVCEATATGHRGPPPPQEEPPVADNPAKKTTVEEPSAKTHTTVEAPAEETKTVESLSKTTTSEEKPATKTAPVEPRGDAPAAPATTSCSKTTTESTNSPRAAPPPSNCTYTTVTPVTPVRGGTKTVYRSTVTYTSSVNCGGCSTMTVSAFNPFHPGPVIFFNATTTLPATTTTAYACQKSSSSTSAMATASRHPRDEVEGQAAGAAHTGPDVSTMTLTKTKYQHTTTSVRGSDCEAHPTKGPGVVPRKFEAISNHEAPQQPSLGPVLAVTYAKTETVVSPGTQTVYSNSCTRTTTRAIPHPTAGAH
ncbi:hypothetical protein GQ53DRAFT_856616 [Thozetella sp. PMI_491]|nr:hypothetical protein GQ53DRAFT_856616 [Thozetella sp. PMI_491]